MYSMVRMGPWLSASRLRSCPAFCSSASRFSFWPWGPSAAQAAASAIRRSISRLVWVCVYVCVRGEGVED